MIPTWPMGPFVEMGLIALLAVSTAALAVLLSTSMARARQWQRLAMLANSEAPLESVTLEIVRNLQSYISARAFVVYRYDEASRRYLLLRDPGNSAERGPGDMDGPSLATVPRERKRADVAMDAPHSLPATPEFSKAGVYAERGVKVFSAPLVASGETVGLFQALHLRSGGVRWGKRRTFSTACEIAGLVLEGTIRRDRDRDRLVSLEAASAVGGAMLESSLNVRSLIEKTLQLLVLSTRSGGAAVIINPDSLQIVGIRERDLGATLFTGGTIDGELCATQMTLQEGSASLSQGKGGAEERSRLSLPIAIGDHSIGTLVLARDTGEAYGPSDHHAAGMFAQQLGEAILNTGAMKATEKTYLGTLRMLVEMMDSRSSDTVGHSQRVKRWASLIGEAMRLEPDEMETLEWAALLHDVGMSGIGEEVLKTGGRLSTDQVGLIRKHPDLGAVICDPLHLPLAVAPGVRSHHERWDGRGYPDGLVGDAIPLHGRIIAVAEVFNALVSARSYRAPRPYSEAVETIRRDRGQAFDPSVVDAFEIVSAIDSETSAPARCHEVKCAGFELCSVCPAYSANQPCWTVRGVLCELHGDRKCEECFVFTSSQRFRAGGAVAQEHSRLAGVVNGALQ